MGRSRFAARSAEEDDPDSRFKRRKIAVGLEDAQSARKELTDGKCGFYHCNYCNKDISGTIRIKCATCPNFDLCVECFSVGAEISPHKCNHPYRVMDNLSFPFLCLDWNADEEMLLLEGIEMYGFGNWMEVADHVGSKTKSECIQHYNELYLNSPLFPLPDLSHVMGKKREELLAMARDCTDEVKEECSSTAEFSMKEELPLSEKINSTESTKEAPAVQSPSSVQGSVTKGSTISVANEVVKDEGNHVDRSFGEKKPRAFGDGGPAVTEFSGYNFKRQEFEVEYDNDAEQLLADMEFRDIDTEAERALKLQVLRIYSKRLDERKRRKDFIVERNLLYPDPFEKNLSSEEREIYNRFKVFMRFHSKEEHEQLLKTIIDEHRMLNRIQELQDARAAGCRMAAEANKFIEQRRKEKKEAEEAAQRLKESALTSPSEKVTLRQPEVSPRGLGRGVAVLSPRSAEAPPLIMEWDISDFVGADLLSDTEKRLCGEIRILPAHYLKMLHIMSGKIMQGNLTKKSDAHVLFKVEPSKIDKVYDMLLSKGIART
ncbi:hypothetical protein MLD38_009072 [Melastoma candidum]|uniref:Uncharacterized protein n=1 Tax=Melastoma candidum TaxID=119954 RepID=A0ACB9RVU2_9MYRT|nr:hypothetical protein MLD38_009072 [Melastoma candidum]